MSGSKLTVKKVMHDIATITQTKVEKPADLTMGPINQTAKELAPSETARRTPETRERIVSSTKRTTIASVKGIAPKIAAIKSS